MADRPASMPVPRRFSSSFSRTIIFSTHRIGHDRSRVGIDQNDAVTLFLKRLAGLGAGIIEFTSLPNHNRPSANDQHGMDVSALWHKNPGDLTAFRNACQVFSEKKFEFAQVTLRHTQSVSENPGLDSGLQTA